MVKPVDGCCGDDHPHQGVGAHSSSGTSAATIPLSQLRDGDCGTVCECDLQGHDGALLRAMGLCPNARVRLCRGGGRMIVAVGAPGDTQGRAGESRIGLARELADKIMVAPGR